MIRTRQTAAERPSQLAGSTAGPAPLHIVIIRTTSGVRDPDKVTSGAARALRTPPAAGPDPNIYNDTNANNSNTHDEEDTGTRPTAGQLAERPRLHVGLTYDAAGSHKTANDVWRGGVLLGSLGEANKRMEGRIGDCRGWSRYIGRVYRGASKKTMIVVETHFPDATYESTTRHARTTRRRSVPVPRQRFPAFRRHGGANQATEAAAHRRPHDAPPAIRL